MARTVERVKRRGVGDDAADLVREAIFDGRFPPGAPLREVELAQQLGVSRGSVREGLAVLAREGLIRTGWHRPTTVIDIEPEDVEEVYALREALDGLAARTAQSRIGASDVSHLLALVDRMAAETAGRGDATALVHLDIAFHDTLYTIAANQRLTRAWQAVRSQVHLFQLRRVRDGYLPYRDSVVREHRQIIRSLQGADPQAVERMAREHVAAARQSLLASLRPDTR
ncbi:GntR family transcriptional regulator [Streptomyces hygroscopicus]|uniref:GntR family transcriptional regulator n=1 Tax=Streptomyces hygroscopicus TaxID=1912 RepID=UPI0004C82587|nr:GntR family transcriptional regulator [Streptomyces hygroscopicus]